jgi:hypothetical protein
VATVAELLMRPVMFCPAQNVPEVMCSCVVINDSYNRTEATAIVQSIGAMACIVR